MTRFITVIVLFILAVSFAFYWYELRPMQKRVACAKISKDIRFAKGKQMNADKDLQAALRLDEGMKNEYAFCLHAQGI